MKITKEIEKILENEGWIVECESPLEISHEESNSISTGMAAELVIESIIENNKKNNKINAKDFLIKIMNDNNADGYEVSYGRTDGRIESYSMDKDTLYGHDSSGSFTIIKLEEVEIDFIREIQICKTIFKS
jgi:hypothetical protein